MENLGVFHCRRRIGLVENPEGWLEIESSTRIACLAMSSTDAVLASNEVVDGSLHLWGDVDSRLLDIVILLGNRDGDAECIAVRHDSGPRVVDRVAVGVYEGSSALYPIDKKLNLAIGDLVVKRDSRDEHEHEGVSFDGSVRTVEGQLTFDLVGKGIRHERGLIHVTHLPL